MTQKCPSEAQQKEQFTSNWNNWQDVSNIIGHEKSILVRQRFSEAKLMQKFNKEDL